MKRLIWPAALAIVAIFGFTSVNYDSEEVRWKEKVSPSVLSTISQGGTANVLIIMKDQAHISDVTGSKQERGQKVFGLLSDFANKSQHDLSNYLASVRVDYQSFYIVNAIQLKADQSLVKNLASRKDVGEVQNNPSTMMEDLDEEIYLENRDPQSVEWGIEMINANDVWEMGYRGEGVVVGGADTGYEWEHPALKSAYRGWDGSTVNHSYNWHDAIYEINPLHEDSIVADTNNPCGIGTSEPCDDHNHGTHTMGSMVGEDGENQIGVAPAAKWVACRNMERGYGSPSTYIACFEWFLAPTDIAGMNPDPSKAPHVINNSWACPEMEGCNPENWAIMENVVNNLKSSGVVVVVSAGNSGRDGCETISNPAAIFENSLTVGSTSANDSISDFSSKGSVTVDSTGRMKPNVSAPGGQVRSSIRGASYATFSGTSMAGPHVVGLVALLISAKPELAGQVEKIEDIIESTAVGKIAQNDCGDVAGTMIPNNTYGYGRIDALAAVQKALSISSAEDLNLKLAAKVYPNPTNGWVHFVLDNIEGAAILEIYSVTGELMHRSSLDTAHSLKRSSITLSGIDSGVYVYKISDNIHTLSGRIIKL